MYPITFPEQNRYWAIEQPKFRPLPAYTNDIDTITKWQFSWYDRLRILFGRPLWLLHFNHSSPLQPLLPTLDYPFRRV
jgi:hypothetical protein